MDPFCMSRSLFFLTEKILLKAKKKKIPVIADSVLVPLKKTDIYKPYLC